MICLYKKHAAISYRYKNLRVTPGFHEPPKDQHVSFHQAGWEGLHEIIFLKHRKCFQRTDSKEDTGFRFVFKGIGCAYQWLEVLDVLDVQVSNDVKMGCFIDSATVIELGEILVIYVNLYGDGI